MQPLHILHDYLDTGFATFRILFPILPMSKNSLPMNKHTSQHRTFSIPLSSHFILNYNSSTQTTLILPTLQMLFLMPQNLLIIQTTTPICTIKTHILSCTT